MNYQINEINNKRYIELISACNPIRTESDALNLIALCWEHEVSSLIIHNKALSEDFFRLRTGTAGDIIQKLINYNIRTAAVIPKETMEVGRFKEMALETNKGNHFRMYDSKEEAVKWLMG